MSAMLTLLIPCRENSEAPISQSRRRVSAPERPDGRPSVRAEMPLRLPMSRPAPARRLFPEDIVEPGAKHSVAARQALIRYEEIPTSAFRSWQALPIADGLRFVTPRTKPC